MRGLTRGLEVLRIIHTEARPQSLHDLHLKSGISKPSLLRILATLEAHRMIRRGIDDRHYHRGVSLDKMHPPSARHERLAAAAAPVLDRLCARVKWPTDLAVRDGDCIKLCESTRSLSPFRLDRAPIGQRISLGDPRQWREIVGIVGDVRHDGLDAETNPEAYFPHRQRFVALGAALDVIGSIFFCP